MVSAGFGKREGTFVYGSGGDGAPFGKSQEANAYCVKGRKKRMTVSKDFCCFALEHFKLGLNLSSCVKYSDNGSHGILERAKTHL